MKRDAVYVLKWPVRLAAFWIRTRGLVFELPILSRLAVLEPKGPPRAGRRLRLFFGGGLGRDVMPF